MSITINGTTGVSGVDGSSTAPAFQGTDTDTGLFYPAADTVAFGTSGSERMRINSSGNVGIGTTGPGVRTLAVVSATDKSTVGVFSGASYGVRIGTIAAVGGVIEGVDTTGISSYQPLVVGGSQVQFTTSGTERMRITSGGTVMIGTTTDDQWFTSTNAGFNFNSGNFLAVARSGGVPIIANRLTSDGDVIEIRQAGTTEGTISVSGTTVSYNGGHLSRWSQWQNESGKPSVYRGTVLESTNDMCEWEKDGEPLPNEQATKTIVSTTVASKTVAGVFDRYDEDDETNPYDFYVAQSGDFVIRIAQGVVVQNGDLLESAGDGTAKPQADDICRSSTIAKVTSNYVSATYEDGSYCVPCILMIG
jgi:hypothetical protein